MMDEPSVVVFAVVVVGMESPFAMPPQQPLHQTRDWHDDKRKHSFERSSFSGVYQV